MIKCLASSRVPAFLNVTDFLMETRSQNGAIKMHVISNTKTDFLKFWLSTFFLLEKSCRDLLAKMVS